MYVRILTFRPSCPSLSIPSSSYRESTSYFQTYLKLLWSHQVGLVHFFQQVEYLRIHPFDHVEEHFQVLLHLAYFLARPCLSAHCPHDLVIYNFDLNHPFSVGTHIHNILLLVVKSMRFYLSEHFLAKVVLVPQFMDFREKEAGALFMVEACIETAKA